MNEPMTPECLDTYRSPQLVDGGPVEDRTQYNTGGSEPEYHVENIIWGQLAAPQTDDTV